MNDSVGRIQIAQAEELNAILQAWAPRLAEVANEKRKAMRLRILAREQCRKPVPPTSYAICTRMAGHSGPCAHTSANSGVDAIGWVPAGLEDVLNVQPYREEAL